MQRGLPLPAALAANVMSETGFPEHSSAQCTTPHPHFDLPHPRLGPCSGSRGANRLPISITPNGDLIACGLAPAVSSSKRVKLEERHCDTLNETP